jgi:membrane protease YdiL (CAAX protease family)
LTVIWGAFTAAVIATALSTMLTVVSSRKQLYWLGSGIMGVLCCLGYYWTQNLWAPILIHVLNDIGFIALNEKRDIFDS